MLIQRGASAELSQPDPHGSVIRRVLVLHSYDVNYPWTAEVTAGLRTVLEAQRFAIDIWNEYLDRRRLAAGEARVWMRQVLEKKYAGREVCLVIACDAAAVEFLREEDPPVLRGKPVVFCGVGSKELAGSLPRSRFTGVEEVSRPADFLNEAVRLLPQTRRVAVVTEATAAGAGHKRFYAEVSRSFPSLEFEFLDGAQLSLGEILARLKKLDASTLVVLANFTLDRDGAYVPAVEAAARVAAASGGPVISPHLTRLGQGVLAGNVSAGWAHGEAAGRMAVRLLQGASPAEVPLEARGNLRLIIDDAVAARWGVPASRFPAGSVVVNRAGGWRALPSSDRRLLLAGFLFLLFQMVVTGALAVNILRRRKIERDLRASQRVLDRAQEIAQLGAWSRNPVSGDLVWSDQVFKLFGLVRGSVRPTLDLLLEMIHPDDRERIADLVRRSDEKRQSRYMEYRIVRPDGSIRYLKSTGEWMAGADGKPVVAGMVQDITDLKKMEEVYREAQRVESLGTLAGGVAHDFNNLLTVINGYAQVLLKSLPEADTRRRMAGQIQRAGERAAELTRHLLAFSRKQMLSPRLLDLNRVIEEACGMLRPVLGEHIQIELALEPGLRPVHADPAQLEQALLNLAANARDAMPEGGTFTIETKNEWLNEFSSFGESAITPGNYVSLRVSDNGCGMEESVRQRVFEPFFTTKPVGRGTGLGLSSVYGIVRQSGGYITVASERGCGTSFQILLPAVEGAISQPAVCDDEVQAGAGVILIVEDEAQIRELMAETLGNAGYVVHCADSAESALALDFGALGGAPQLLLTDIVMPGGSGVYLARRLRERIERLKVLLMSGYAGDDLKMEDLPGASFLAKPFTPAILTAAVRNALEEGARW